MFKEKVFNLPVLGGTNSWTVVVSLISTSTTFPPPKSSQ